MSSRYPSHARVDLLRLEENYRAVQSYCSLPMMPVVKADAYGHGAPRIALAFEKLGAQALAVAFPEEGLAIRRAGVRIPVLVLGGFVEGQADLLIGEGLTPVLSTEAMAQGFLEACRRAGKTPPVHLEVDCGMGRLGFPVRDFSERAARLRRDGLEVEGVMTHLPSADEDAELTEKHLDLFDQALDALSRKGIRPPFVHASHSAGLSHLRKTHTLVRPGLLLYGLKPRPLAPEIPVRPVMSVHASVALLKDVPENTPISYGGRWVSKRPSKIATVPLGYADGVPRSLGIEKAGSFLVRGQRTPLAGRVCMDFVMLDATDLPEVREGDPVTFFGDEPTAWDVASWAGTHAWEILTRVGGRVLRVYVDGDKVQGP